MGTETQFFHASANKKQKANTIHKITDEQGRLCEDQETISNAFVQYYTNLFSTSGTGNISACLSTMERKITLAMNNELLKEFTMDEVRVALN